MIGTILLMAAAAAEAPICADRPSKANGTCTVPQGRVQIETGLIDWTRNRADGTQADLTLWGSSFLKYGISRKSDIEFGFTPFETLNVHDGPAREHASGVGDLTIRFKQRLTDDAAPVQAAVIPFVKVPTASRRLGNGKVEGGVAVPLSVPLGKSGLTLTAGPELDLRADADGHGYHLATAQLVNLGYAMSPRLSVAAELWGGRDWDPAGTGKQASADAAAAFLLSNDVQLDAGANFGLNEETPDVELYGGFSTRF